MSKVLRVLALLLFAFLAIIVAFHVPVHETGWMIPAGLGCWVGSTLVE